MLEITILLEFLLHKNIEAGVIAMLLMSNAALSIVRECHARRAPSLPRRRLSIQFRVRRDCVWQRLAAEGIVPELPTRL